MPKQKSQNLKPKSLLQRWFKDSSTILIARTTDTVGFVTAVVGALDWSPLLGVSGMNRTQVITMGGIVLLIGISHEVARRRTLNA